MAAAAGRKASSLAHANRNFWHVFAAQVLAPALVYLVIAKVAVQPAVPGADLVHVVVDLRRKDISTNKEVQLFYMVLTSNLVIRYN